MGIPGFALRALPELRVSHAAAVDRHCLQQGVDLHSLLKPELGTRTTGDSGDERRLTDADADVDDGTLLSSDRGDRSLQNIENAHAARWLGCQRDIASPDAYAHPLANERLHTGYHKLASLTVASITAPAS